MSESIQFRGPLEVEGPDDLDDDDNYMKPGLETTGLKNRQQKDQPTKKALYFAVGCLLIGILYFLFTYQPNQTTITQFATKTLFGCNRNQYYTQQGCEPSAPYCLFSIEFTGKCIVCQLGYSLNFEGECKPIKQSFYSNLYRSTTHPTKEIPYIIVNKENSQKIMYVFETHIFDNLINYTSLNYTIVQIEDYSLLKSPEYQSIFNELSKFVEKTLNITERIFVAHDIKVQGLLNYLKNVNSTDIVYIVEPPETFEVPNLKIKLLYSGDNCPIQEIKCFKIQDGNFIQLLIQP